MPKLVKYQDDEGLLHTISQIHVLTQEKKYYCGIPSRNTGAVQFWEIKSIYSGCIIILRKIAGRSVGKEYRPAGERRKNRCAEGIM